MRYLLILSSLLLASPSHALVRVLMEGVPSTKYVLYVDTINARAYLSTGSYTGGIIDVGLYVTSNTVWSNTATGNKVVVYASGTIVAQDLRGAFTGALNGTASLATALAANPTDCAANEFANAIDAQGNLTCAVPAGSGGESNTYTSSKTFTAAMESAGFTDRGQATVTSTLTVQGNAFSVGGSTFIVLGGSATLAYQMTAAKFSGPLTGNVTGNADTATALAADPVDCTLPNVALGINAAGTAQCSQPSNVTGNSATATALAANGTNAASGFLCLGVDASGNCEAAHVATVGASASTEPVTSGALYTHLNDATAHSAGISGNAATATKATNIAGGGAGQTPYQSAADTTLFLPALGAAGVVSGNGGAPSTYTLTGTVNQVVITRTGAPAALTFSLPQNIDTGASPTFNTVTASLTGHASLDLPLSGGAGSPMTGTLVAPAGVSMSTLTATSSATFKDQGFSIGTSSFVVAGGSATVGYGLTAQTLTTVNSNVTGQQTVVGTSTVLGNAFSVGGSSFVVAGGSATVAYQMTMKKLNITTAPTLCSAGNYPLGIDGNGNAASCTAVAGGSETNTFTSSKTIQGDMLVRYGLTVASVTVIGTTTVQGNAFSVGGATFTVAGGSATVAYGMTMGNLISNPGGKGLLQSSAIGVSIGRNNNPSATSLLNIDSFTDHTYAARYGNTFFNNQGMIHSSGGEFRFGNAAGDEARFKANASKTYASGMGFYSKNTVAVSTAFTFYANETEDPVVTISSRGLITSRVGASTATWSVGYSVFIDTTGPNDTTAAVLKSTYNTTNLADEIVQWFSIPAKALNQVGSGFKLIVTSNNKTADNYKIRFTMCGFTTSLINFATVGAAAYNVELTMMRMAGSKMAYSSFGFDSQNDNPFVTNSAKNGALTCDFDVANNLVISFYGPVGQMGMGYSSLKYQ